MFAAFATLYMSHVSFTTLMQPHLTPLFNCFFTYHFIIDCKFFILCLFTVCNLRELKLPMLMRIKVYCIIILLT